jgi:predicted nucleotidyltransferase
MVTERELRHLSEQERMALDGFLARLLATHGREVSQVQLFGSKARGDSDAESDIDLLVVVERNGRRLWNDVVALETDLMLEYDTVISSLIMSREDYEWHKLHRAPLYRNVEREGVDLWTSTSMLSSLFGQFLVKPSLGDSR